MQTITHDTLAEELKSGQKKIIVIDCRFDYEFKGGHIKDAKNVSDPNDLEKLFFHNKQAVEEIMSSNTSIVFHCEFSQKRGPQMYRKMREIDRELHMAHYPKLFYSEIYLLEGGYKTFYEHHPELCSQAYVSMYDDNFKQECKSEFSKNKRSFKMYSCKGLSSASFSGSELQD